VSPGTVERFDLADPLPRGTLAIEASAGTGKTYTLAALAARAIAELGVPADDLLVVTFTRAATRELRNRVRTQLVHVAQALRHPTASEPDPWITELGTADPAERQRRADRLDRAVTEFDAVTITTIHGFATQVLGTLGAGSGIDPDVTLVDDATELRTEVCADLLAAAAVTTPDPGRLPTLKRLVEATGRRCSMPDLVLAPGPADGCDDAAALQLVELVDRAVTEIADRRLLAGTMSFDDVLLHLRTALEGDGGDAVLASLRGRYAVALIDEFQDTDPVQWAIFSALFGEASPDSRLVLVGDPKQAIYSFRGANVHTFSRATEEEDVERRSLETNWRSDGALLRALNALFAGTTFGDDRIAYVEVEAAPDNQAKRLTDAGGTAIAPLDIRLAVGGDLDRNKTRPNAIAAPAADRAVYGDLGAHLVELLAGARLPAEGGDTRPVRPSDIAVLVKSHREAEAVQRELLARKVPAVLARGTSVLTSPAAGHWRLLLEGLLRPSDPRRARGYALSWFSAHDATDVATLDDDTLGTIQDQLHGWNEVLEHRGVAAWARQVLADSGVEARVLAEPEGDRLVTDLHHLAELFQAAAHHDRLHLSGLLAVLNREPEQTADADIDAGGSARRIESDDRAVQIMTVWAAKGLEFPIVCVPTLWRTPLKFGIQPIPVIYQDPVTGARTEDLAPGAGWPTAEASDRRRSLSDREAIGENLRLLYVALTRAQHHAVVWWSRVQGSEASGLSHLLFCRTDGVIDPTFADEKITPPADEEALGALDGLVARSSGSIVAEVIGKPGKRTTWQGTPRTGDEGDLAVADRPDHLDRSRHRWSFSAVTQQFEVERGDPYDQSLSDGGAADEGGADETTDPDGFDLPAEGDPTPVSATSPMASLPAGPAFGNLVHAVFETLDFADADLDATIQLRLDEALATLPVDLTPTGVDEATPEEGRELLVAGMRAAIETPLGARFSDLRLRDVPHADRLNELSFELRLGDVARYATVGDIGRLVSDHLGDDDPLQPWARDLAAGAIEVDLAGHLTGSIDLVFRTPGPVPRFVIADYKTNRLTPRGEPQREDDYARRPMTAAMAEHHYPLQALLYSVALHRYLRWRLEGYDPAVHLGGAVYLFVRGMTGSGVTVEDGHPHGVFDWAVPPALVVALSNLLDGHPGTGSAS